MSQVRSIAMRTILVSTGLALAVSLIRAFGAAQAAVPVVVDTERTSRMGWRGPTALWLTPDGESLVAACEKSGTLVVIDVASRSIAAEHHFGKALVSIASTTDGKLLAVCDAKGSKLILLERRGAEMRKTADIALPASPMCVIMDPDSRNAFVTCSWSRQVVRVELDTNRTRTLADLDFPPRAAILLPDGHTLAVADAFGGKLALVDTRDGRLVREVDIPGHNFHGLALSASGKELLISHMILTESAPITRDNVFWGIAMTANMRVVPIAALFDAAKNPVREAHTHFFGDPGNGAGDPSAMATLGDGTMFVCLSGVGDVAVGRYQPYSFRRLHVGQRPTALAVSPDQKSVFVANSHSDTISLIDVEKQSVSAEIQLDPHNVSRTRTVVEEGERLFYDARVSLDGWFSCHSCHTDGHTNGARADTLGDGGYGAPKTVLSLLGTAATDPWAWNGRKGQLEDQARESLRHTMQPKTAVTERTIAALTTFMRTLEPPPATAWQHADADSIARGQRVFESRRCATCHSPPSYSNPFTYDVGLDDGEGGNRLFNPPSLQGVGHRTSYFHDGRAKTLEEIFQKHQHRLRTALAHEELADLVAFLRSL